VRHDCGTANQGLNAAERSGKIENAGRTRDLSRPFGVTANANGNDSAESRI